MVPPLGFWAPSGMEIVLILVIGLLLFGGNLPDVGRSLGRSLIEFRKGLRDLKRETGLDEMADIKREIREMASVPELDEEPPGIHDAPYQEIEEESDGGGGDPDAGTGVEEEKAGGSSEEGPVDGKEPPPFGYQGDS